jgi:hypothetical protein
MVNSRQAYMIPRDLIDDLRCSLITLALNNSG